MKKIILLIVFLALVFTGFLNRTTLANTANNFLYQSPCQSPKTFRLGTVDPRFHITKDELLQDAQEAGGVWKNEQGMILMQYDPNSQMPINMVYDQRQYLDSQINNLNDQVAQQKDSLKPQIADYQQKAAEFKKESTDLNTQIDYWNTKGGAPQDVYNGLVAKQHSLQQEATQLSQMADQLNQSTDAYNQQIQQLNQKVNNYNNVLSYKPEEGLYTKDGTNEKIDIYFNNSRVELVHTLAHEMGHSLGLGHNSNPASVMYPYTNQAVTPSVDDENALTEVCKKQSVFAIAEQNIMYLITTIKQNSKSIIQ